MVRSTAINLYGIKEPLNIHFTCDSSSREQIVNVNVSRLGGDSGQRRRGEVVDDSKVLQRYIYEGLQEDDRRRLPRA